MYKYTHVLINSSEREYSGGRDLGVVVAEGALDVLGGVVHSRADLAKTGEQIHIM